MKLLIAILLLTGLNCGSGYGQTVRYTQAQQGSSLTVKGTSTLHDWHMTSTSPAVTAEFTQPNKGAFTEVRSLTVNVTATTLHSDKDGLDKNAYEALNVKTHPSLRFVQTGAATLSDLGSGKYGVKVQGNLTVAGTTKAITVPATCTQAPDGSLTCTGSVAFSMTTYGVKPPSLMLGTIKTADPITIEFTVRLTPVR